MKTAQARPCFPWIVWNRTVARYEDIGFEGLDWLEYSQPRHTVALRHVREFVSEEQFAEIGNPVLRDEDDGVPRRMRPTEIENLNLFPADMERHAIAKCCVRQSRPLLVGGRATTLHLLEKACAIVVVPNLEDIRVGQISFTELIVEGRRNKVANGLLDDTRNRFALGTADGFRSQGIDDQRSFARDDDAAAEGPAARQRGVHVVTRDQLPQASRVGGLAG